MKKLELHSQTYTSCMCARVYHTRPHCSSLCSIFDSKLFNRYIYLLLVEKSQNCFGKKFSFPRTRRYSWNIFFNFAKFTLKLRHSDIFAENMHWSIGKLRFKQFQIFFILRSFFLRRYVSLNFILFELIFYDPLILLCILERIILIFHIIN